MGFKTREFNIYHSGGDVVDGLGERVATDLRSELRGKEVKSDELEKVLSELDFDCLNGILRDLALRSGADPEGINLLNKEHVFNDVGLSGDDSSNKHTSGGYRQAGNIVFINMEGMTQDAEVVGLDDKTLLILQTIIHELVHAVSKNETNYYLPDKEFKNLSILLKN